jgi:hypothetical protein
MRGFQTVDLLCERRDLPSALGLRQQDERRPGRDHSREIGHAVAGERVHAHGGDDSARAPLRTASPTVASRFPSTVAG